MKQSIKNLFLKITSILQVVQLSTDATAPTAYKDAILLRD